MRLILSIVGDITNGGKKECREVLKINASMEHDFITDCKIVKLIASNSQKLLFVLRSRKQILLIDIFDKTTQVF